MKQTMTELAPQAAGTAGTVRTIRTCGKASSGGRPGLRATSTKRRFSTTSGSRSESVKTAEELLETIKELSPEFYRDARPVQARADGRSRLAVCDLAHRLERSGATTRSGASSYRSPQRCCPIIRA